MGQVHGFADMSYGTNAPYELGLISEGVGYGRELLSPGVTAMDQRIMLDKEEIQNDTPIPMH